MEGLIVVILRYFVGYNISYMTKRKFKALIHWSDTKHPR